MSATLPTISVNRRAFSRAATLAQSVIERRNAIPALGTIRATANGSLALEATDLDMTARAEMPYSGDHTTFLLPDPHRVLAAINAGAETDDIRITNADAKRIDVQSGTFEARLTTIPSDDFPTLLAVAEEDFGVDLTAADLAQIARIVPAISTEETRYYLNGICVHKLDDWTWRFVATDGHRLMMVDVPLPGATGTLRDKVILRKAWVRLVIQHFRKSEQAIRLSWGPRIRRNEAPTTIGEDSPAHVIAVTGLSGDHRLTLTSKVIDGTYPDYTRVVPAQSTHAARLDRAALARAIRAVMAISSHKTRAIRLTFAPDQVKVSLHSPDLGDARLSVAAQHNVPDKLEVGFNARYLLDILTQLRGDEVMLAWDAAKEELQIPGQPCTITDPADTAFKAVLMPMRV